MAIKAKQGRTTATVRCAGRESVGSGTTVARCFAELQPYSDEEQGEHST